MVKIGVIGGSGYTGAELLSLLAKHPEVSVHCVTSTTQHGQAIAKVLPAFRNILSMDFEPPGSPRLFECELLFFAAPTGVAMTQAPKYLTAGIKVVDLSADFRIKDPKIWQQWYQLEHTALAELDEAVYGLPEYYRDEIRVAKLVANPGCYPTAILLGVLPLVTGHVIDNKTLIADAKSGVTGAGKQAKLAYHFAELTDSFKAYAASGHRHLPEIQQILQQHAGTEVQLAFVPHLVPMLRGIHATVYVDLIDQTLALQELYEAHYQTEQFVDVLPTGSHPQTRHVAYQNVCQLAVHRQGHRAIILSVIDNLQKGAASQAIQNMNLLLDYPEHTGLF